MDTIRVRAKSKAYYPAKPGDNPRMLARGTVFEIAAGSKIGKWMEVVPMSVAPLAAEPAPVVDEAKPEKKTRKKSISR